MFVLLFPPTLLTLPTLPTLLALLTGLCLPAGERLTLKDSETSVTTGLSLNGRLFVSPKDHLDALVSLGSLMYLH